MSILSVLNPKGGSGKTTISTNLARSLHERGHSVLIVDSDPQGSARDWHAASEDNPIELVALDRPNNVKTLTSMAANYDYVVIDGAAKLEDMIAACIKVSDSFLSRFSLHLMTSGQHPTWWISSRPVRRSRTACHEQDLSFPG